MVILEDPPLLPPANAIEMRERRARFRQQVAKLQSMSAQEIAAYGHEQSPDWHADEFPAWVEGKQQVDPEVLPEFTALWQQDFAAITVPTLLICGEAERGGMVIPAPAAEAEALNANIRTVQIDRAGRNIRRENFADYVTAVRAFLCAHAE